MEGVDLTLDAAGCALSMLRDSVCPVALTELQIIKLVEKYARERDRFEKMATTVARHLTARLRATATPHMATVRSKSPESLRGKMARDSTKYDIKALDGEFNPTILDLAGVRILLYRPQDIQPTCSAIDDLFALPEGERFRRDHENPGGYQARHRVVTLPDDMVESDPMLTNLKDVHCEVQVVTLVQHIWNELEHDLIYKTPAGKPSPEQTVLLATLRDQTTLVQSTVTKLMEATARQHAANLTAIESPQDLQQALRVRCGRTVNGDLERLLKLLVGVTYDVTPASLNKLPLSGEELDAAVARLSTADISIRGDEVNAVVAALWPHYRAEFVAFASSWPGPRSPIRRLIDTLKEAQDQGRL